MKIAVLGHGWLSNIFHENFHKNYEICVTTRSLQKRDKLRNNDIDAELFSIEDGQFTNIFQAADVVISMLPPGLRRNDTTNVDQYVLEAAKNCKNNFIFISSTSVYGSHQELVTETSKCEPKNRSGKFLVNLEEKLRELLKDQLTIIRPGGLVGENRNPKAFYQNRPVTNPQGFINFVHGNDVTRAISFIIENKLWGEDFNLCYPEEIKRIDFYKKILGADAKFEIDNGERKRVIGTKIMTYGFEYKYGVDSID